MSCIARIRSSCGSLYRVRSSETKRKIVLAWVERVEIGVDREMKVISKVDPSLLLNQSLLRGQERQGGTYTRILDLTALGVILVEL